MYQLLQNLINNGLKFHQEELPPMIQISASNSREKCKLTVKDNGIGFDMQYLDRIFKPFQRLHRKETAAACLAICRRIVERHSGEITALSTPREGSVFVITLPMHQFNGENTHG
jgi:signal transduction histidine kinase